MVTDPDYITCERCSISWHKNNFAGDSRLCPECKFSDAVKEQRLERERQIAKMVKDPATTLADVDELTPEMFDEILSDWLRGNWVDGISYWWVGILLRKVYDLQQTIDLMNGED